MSQKKSFLGKVFAFTTVVATIGGVCYVFRDKIKNHPLYEKTKEKVSDTICKVTEGKTYSDEFVDNETEDFDSIFSDSNKSREYTSITINANNTEEETNTEETTIAATEDEKEEVIPTITFDQERQSNLSTREAESYENEGLSDVSEDPDVLLEQDQLDF